MQAVPPPPPAVVVQVVAARTYDRANKLDSARVLYEAAARSVPGIADWLWLRAAGVTADRETRQLDYANVHTSVARARIPWTEAEARERTGDLLGAAHLYDSLGAHLTALRNLVALGLVPADSLSSPPRLVPPANSPVGQYVHARQLVADGDRKGAQKVLRALLKSSPRDTAAANAMMLLADLATDEGRDQVARSFYQDLLRRFPKNRHAQRARFLVAMITYISGDPKTAATEWDALVTRNPKSDERTAARYWSGRAWARVGRKTTAASRWRAVLHDEPLSYYALLSARQLKLKSLLAISTTDTAVGPTNAVVDSALSQSVQLRQFGLLTEAHFENDYAADHVGDAPAAMLAAGAAFLRAGDAPHAINLGWQLSELPGVVGDSARHDIRVYRLIFPLEYGDILKTDAKAQGLSPVLVAAVIRQESSFNAHAVSSTGARGLMQLMPDVGRTIARASNTPWDPAVLDSPSVNISFGVAHLATSIAQEHGDTLRGVAAYNAGLSRVDLWSTRRGVKDPEVFVERIPFTETRDYVRSIVHGLEVYSSLYGDVLK